MNLAGRNYVIRKAGLLQFTDSYLRTVLFLVSVYSNFQMAKKKYPQWYKTHNLKHVTGFLTMMEKQKLRMLASAADKSLSRYVTRLLQQHIKDMTAHETEDGRPKDGHRNVDKN